MRHESLTSHGLLYATAQRAVPKGKNSFPLLNGLLDDAPPGGGVVTKKTERSSSFWGEGGGKHGHARREATGARGPGRFTKKKGQTLALQN